MSRSQRGAENPAVKSPDAGSPPAALKTPRAAIPPVKASAQPPQHTSVCGDGEHCPTPDQYARSQFSAEKNPSNLTRIIPA